MNENNNEFTDLEEQLLSNADKFDEAYNKYHDLKSKIKYNYGNFLIFGFPAISIAGNYVMVHLLEKYGTDDIKVCLGIVEDLAKSYNLSVSQLLSVSEVLTIFPIFISLGLIKNFTKIHDKKKLEQTKQLLAQMKKDNKELVEKIKTVNTDDINQNLENDKLISSEDHILKLSK